jgi:hypothetical protein
MATTILWCSTDPLAIGVVEDAPIAARHFAFRDPLLAQRWLTIAGKYGNVRWFSTATREPR